MSLESGDIFGDGGEISGFNVGDLGGQAIEGLSPGILNALPSFSAPYSPVSELTAFSDLTPGNVDPFKPAAGGWLSSFSTALNQTLGIGTPSVSTGGLFEETSGQTIAPVRVTRDPPPSTFNQFKPWNPLGTALSASNPFGTPAKPSSGPSLGLLLLAGIVVAAIVLMTSSGGKK